jgi:integrase
MLPIEQGGGTPRATVRLTKRAIDQAKPLPKSYFVWDGELKGFGAPVDPGGGKTFAVRYRPKSQGASAPKRFMTIGRYGALTVDEARNRAKEILGAVARGEDPAADLALKRAASTFKEIAELFLREHVGPKRKMSTAQSYESLLNAYAIPALGSRKAEAVTRAELSRLHGQIGNRPYQANRLLAVIGSLYTFAERHGLVPENCNPTRKIEKFPEDRRERFLTPDELERLGAAIREGETVGIAWREDGDAPKSKHLARQENRRTFLSPDAASALRLLIFTGARLREILHLRWEHVDLGRGLLLLPGRKTIVLNRPLSISCRRTRATARSSLAVPILIGRGQISRSPGWLYVGARGSKAFGCTTCGTRLRPLARERALVSRLSANSSVIRKRRRPPATPIWTLIRCCAQRTSSASGSRDQ